MSEKVLLIADDDEDILALVRFRMELLGYQVVQARDGVEAMELVKAHAPDLAILDVMMPKMDGLEVTRRLRADDGPRFPILLLTANAQDTDVSRGFEAGADDYLRKPFAPDELRARVQALLARN
jgi:DNA-binding response OmpR family regulator